MRNSEWAGARHNDRVRSALIISWSAQFQREIGCSLLRSASNQRPLTDNAMRGTPSACHDRTTRSTRSTPIGPIRLIGLIGPVRPEKVRGPLWTPTTTNTPTTREISLRRTLLSGRVSGPAHDRSRCDPISCRIGQMRRHFSGFRQRRCNEIVRLQLPWEAIQSPIVNNK